MRNNLLNIEKNLRSIAKRYKSVKYSIGLAILFLMMGVNAFSEEITTADNAVANQTVMTRAEIKSTAAKLQEQLNELKKQNQDVTKGAKLELIQLMEQGNQVVKSPWASWQFGVNFFYDHWGSTYKGRGDKAEKYPYEGVFTRENNTPANDNGGTNGTPKLQSSFDRYVIVHKDNKDRWEERRKEITKDKEPWYASDDRRIPGKDGSHSYGLGGVTIPREPVSTVNVAAAITPKSIDKQPINIVVSSPHKPVKPEITVDIASPEPVPDTVIEPVSVEVNIPEVTAKPFVSYDFKPGGRYSTNTNLQSAFSEDRLRDADISARIAELKKKYDDQYKSEIDSINNDTNLTEPEKETKRKAADQKKDEATRAYTKPVILKDDASEIFWIGYDPKPNLSDTEKIKLNKAGIYTDTYGVKTGGGGYSNTTNDFRPVTNIIYIKNFNNIITDETPIGGFSFGGTTTKPTKIYLKGYDNEATLPAGITKRGASGIHNVWNTRFHNIYGELKGNSALFSLENWHAGKISLENIEANITGNENTLFLYFPGIASKIFQAADAAHAYRQRGEIVGEVRANITDNSNIVYSIYGVTGSINIESKGIYELEGSSNIIYSGLGYAPNFQNLIGTVAWNSKDKNGAQRHYELKPGEKYYKIGGLTENEIDMLERPIPEAKKFADGNRGMTPLINIKEYSQIYGDGNKGLYFSDLVPKDTADSPYGGDADNWSKTKIGIFQGDIRLNLRIGEQLQKSSTATSQTDKGNTEKDAKWVEKNVGILAQSGQRDGTKTKINKRDVNGKIVIGELEAVAKDRINIQRDLVPNSGLFDDKGNANNGKTILDTKDPIHSLHVNDIDVTFGKFAKNNMAIVADVGTVVDVAVVGENTMAQAGDPTAADYATTKTDDKKGIPVRTTTIKDYNLGTGTKVESSVDSTTNQAATNTIYALATGTWGDSDTGRNKDGVGYARNKKWSVADAYKDLPSEINIGTSLEMASKANAVFENGKLKEIKDRSIAYAAAGKKKADGTYTTGGRITAKDTTMKGFGSVVAYAKNKGTVIVDGNITAIDEWAAKDTETTKVHRYNIGAYADGEESTIAIKKNSKIYGTGAFADNKGEIVLKGSGTAATSTDDENTYAGNYIKVGKNPGLIAQDGGLIDFKGGIIHLDEKADKNALPFYVTSKGTTIKNADGTTRTTTEDGRIVFSGDTRIRMAKGLFLLGDPNSFDVSAPATANTATKKYSGIGNITLQLTGHGVNVGVFEGYRGSNGFTYGSNGILDSLKTKLGLHDVDNLDGFSYKANLIDGSLDIDTNINLNADLPKAELDNPANTTAWDSYSNVDKNSVSFNRIKMEKELVTINAGKTVTGDVSVYRPDPASTTSASLPHQGLSMGSKMSANAADASNLLSGYINKGTINITGGTAAKKIAAVNVNFGQIHNESTGKITADIGTAMFGENGSKLVNEGEVSVSGAESAAIYAKSGTDAKIKQADGTEVDVNYGPKGGEQTTGNYIEIKNTGEVNATGDKSVGIFANNDKGIAKAQVKVDVDQTSGKKITVGKEGTGVLLGATNSQGGTLTLVGTGSEDIVVGETGIGVFAESSDVTIGTLGIKVKDNGTGIYMTGSNSTSTGAGPLTVKYDGTATGTVTGIAYGYANATNSTVVNMENSSTPTDKGIINIYANGGGTFTNNANLTLATSTKNAFGIIGDNSTAVKNTGEITVGESTATDGKNIGIYMKSDALATNSGKITVGKKSIGIYGTSVTTENSSVIDGADAAIGVYSRKGNVTIGGSLKVGKAILEGTKVKLDAYGNPAKDKHGNIIMVDNYNEAVGVYTTGENQTIENNASTFTIGERSFGFVNSPEYEKKADGTPKYTKKIGASVVSVPVYKGTSGNKITSNVGNVTLSHDSVYIYSADDRPGATVTNNTNITMTGDSNYGIYSAGTVTNTKTIDMSAAGQYGNVAMYSTKGGTATNAGNIKVGATDPKADKTLKYTVGMVGGYSVFNSDTTEYDKIDTGNIINTGTIDVVGEKGIAMFATGKGSSAKNTGTINLNADNAVGIYAENEATVENSGKILSTGKTGVVGVFLGTGTTLVNTSSGEIALQGTDATGVALKGGTVKNYGKIVVNGTTAPNGGNIKSPSPAIVAGGGADLEKVMGNLPNQAGINMMEEPGKILKNGVEVKPNIMYHQDPKNGVPTISNATRIGNIDNIYQTINGAPKYVQANSIGMYVDTSGVYQTKPIENVGYLTEKADLIIGAEAANRTLSKAIRINDEDIQDNDKKILLPYNQSIAKNPQVKTWSVYSGSLTWMAMANMTTTSPAKIKDILMTKVPYTVFASNEPTPVEVTDTYNFLDGLEQRYGVDGLGTRERRLFEKLNMIGNNESVLFHQAVDEMMGHQYANTQQRVYQTGSILDKEFSYLKKEWQTFSKDSNKVKVFGARGQYKTDTAGVIDTTNHGYGVAYLHEDETVRLGKTLGWYAGIVENDYRFKDIGNSKEKMLQGKVGVFKSYPFDYDNSLNATVYGELLAGYNRMHRKFLVVDEIFNAKSRYKTYGAAIKGEVSKEFRLSEDFRLKPYASLKYEYGRIGKIRERSGEIKLEVKSNTYHSLKPEIGGELEYKHDFGSYRTFRTTLGIAYENELGRVADGRNKARVVDTQADWFNIRGEKEDRRGNVKSDLKIGIDNSRVGATLDFGYDTKGNNVRGGLGLRIIY